MKTAEQMMAVAFKQAEIAAGRDEVPVGAALFDAGGKLLFADHNRCEELSDPTAHAELLILKKACRGLATKYLQPYTLVVTLEPCAMCAQAMAWCKLGQVIYGAHDPKSGGVTSGVQIFDAASCHHKPSVTGGVMAGLCGQLLRDFFKEKRHVGSK